MSCDALTFVERILDDWSIQDKDILQAQIFLRVGCPNMKKLEGALNDHAIKQDQKRRDENDPTTQE